MPDIGGREVRYLGCGVYNADARGGKGHVLLEPEEGGGDGSAEVRGCVNGNGDVGAIESDWGDQGGCLGGDWILLSAFLHTNIWRF